MLQAMRANARAHGLGALIACVRPTDKHRYPLIPIERYAFWTRPDGEPFDAWIRLHRRLGGRVVRGSPNAMTMRGTVAEWEAWTGLSFPGSGDYLLPHATNPMTMDLERDEGVYHDANVWMVHPIDGPWVRPQKVLPRQDDREVFPGDAIPQAPSSRHRQARSSRA
jgi:hypothetical protein